VLLDHRWMFSGIPDRLADPSTGLLFEAHLPEGRARVLGTREGRQALLTRVIAPLVRRYGTGGARADLGAHILAFELMNEPDFVVEEWERDLSPRVARPLAFEALAELVSALCAVAHRAGTMATMSAARVHNLWAWGDPELGLDFVQLHSYPDLQHPERDRDVFGMPAASLGMAKPLVLGEFPCDAPRQHPPGTSPPDTTLADYLEFALAHGYLGAWPWSFSGTDAYGRVPEEPLLEFARRHPHLVNPRVRPGNRMDTDSRPIQPGGTRWT
jgi:hypothetical protein